ncbi:MAG: hypothetical protein NT015_08910 [Alphaproteobacteria bacterium]|nr:hypothetical protein [Alphaproteobacteria bacterium]
MDGIRISPEELSRQNMAVVMLGQALLGAITPNFRMVAINLKHEPWQVRFVLESDDVEDREEIGEVEDCFENYVVDMGRPDFRFEVVIDDREFPSPKYPWLVVFLRK